jgi:HAD superfamily hydrolase (TIGR01549 family)
MCKEFGKKQSYKTIDKWRWDLHSNWKVNYFRAGFSEEELDKVFDKFKGFTKTQKYPLNKGVEELIIGLYKENIEQVIVSSNYTGIIKRNLGDLSKYFKFIIDYDDVTKIKPHPQPLLLALERTNTSPEGARYLGDMATDIIAAYNANIPCIIHTNGFHPKEKLQQVAEKYKNCKLVDSIKEAGKYLL